MLLSLPNVRGTLPDVFAEAGPRDPEAPTPAHGFLSLRRNKRRPLRLNCYRCSAWNSAREAIRTLMCAGLKGAGQRFRRSRRIFKECQDKVGSDNHLASVYFVFGGVAIRK